MAAFERSLTSWFTNFDDAYRITPIAFILCVYFIGMLAIREHIRAERLQAQSEPTTRIVFDPPRNPLYDSLHHDETLRIFRVGILNTGASVENVAVKVSRILPEPPRVFPMQELRQTHKEGVSRFTVNKSEEPLVFVDVIHQDIHRADGVLRGTSLGKEFAKPYKKGTARQIGFAFADVTRLISLDVDEYLIWLAIDGPHAEGTRKFVLRRNKSGQYDMTVAPFG